MAVVTNMMNTVGASPGTFHVVVNMEALYQHHRQKYCQKDTRCRLPLLLSDHASLKTPLQN